MAEIDRPSLRALAAAATPGPWRTESQAIAPGDSDTLEIIGSPPGGGEVVAIVDAIECSWGDAPATQYERNARYIAAVSPPVLLALLDALDAAERERAKLRAMCEAIHADASMQIADGNCECECRHAYDEHGDDCGRCFPCRVAMAVDRARGNHG